MNILNDHILSLIVITPLLGALIISLLPGGLSRFARGVAVGVSIVLLSLCSVLFAVIERTGEFDFSEMYGWMPELGVNYHVGADGASASLLLMVAVVLLVAIFVSFGEIIERRKTFYAMMLVSAAGALGAFVSMNLYLFFMCYMLATFPIFFIVGIFGGDRKNYAAMKFVIFMSASGALLLIGIISASVISGSSEVLSMYSYRFSAHEQLFLFPVFALAFGIAVPLIFLHTWFPDASDEAPIAGSIIIAAISVKLGLYGFFRIALPSFPAAALHYNDFMMVVAVIGIVAGSMTAMAQSDLKRMISFSTIPYMSMALLGLLSSSSIAAEGAIMHMVNHGIALAALFAILAVISQRIETHRISEMGGLARTMPVASAFFIIFAMAYAGLPVFNIFPGEFLIFLGSFQTGTYFAALGMLGILVTMSSFAWMLYRVFFGGVRGSDSTPAMRLRFGEGLLAIIMLVVMLVAGFYPGFLISRIERSAKAFAMLSTRVEMIIPASDLGDPSVSDAQDILRRE